MEKGLVLIWNVTSFIEFYEIRDDTEDYYVLIDEEYITNKEQRTVLEKFLKGHERFGTIKGVITLKEALKMEFEELIVKSWLTPYVYNLIDNMKYNKLVMIEEGFSDYFRQTVNKKDKKIYSQADFYCSVPEFLLVKDVYKSVNKINYNIMESDFMQQVIDIHKDKDYDIVLFTSPLNIDNNYENYYTKLIAHLEERYAGKNILIKKHPRDAIEYTSTKCNFELCNPTIPSQMIDEMYPNALKYYVAPSTTMITSKYLNKSIVFLFSDLLSSSRYLRGFKNKFVAECYKELIF